MCRRNFVLLMIYIIISIGAGLALSNIILSLIGSPGLVVTLFVYFLSTAAIGLFLLPALNRFTD